MSYANKRGHAKAFDSGIAGAEFITTSNPIHVEALSRNKEEAERGKGEIVWCIFPTHRKLLLAAERERWMLS